MLAVCKLETSVTRETDSFGGVQKLELPEILLQNIASSAKELGHITRFVGTYTRSCAIHCRHSSNESYVTTPSFAEMFSQSLGVFGNELKFSRHWMCTLGFIYSYFLT